MSSLEKYPMTHRNETKRLRALLQRVPGLGPRECEEYARTINGMADKACDLNDIFQSLLKDDLAPEQLAELLIAFELTTEQIRGDSGTIDGKLYELADRLRDGANGPSQ